MPRNLLLAVAIAAAIADARAQSASPVAANPFVLLPRCPDDAAAQASSFKLGPALTPDDSIEVRGDQVSADSERNARLQGRIEVRQGDKTLSADQVDISSADDRIEVKGKVEYRDPQLVVRGDTGSLANGEAAFTGAQFELPQQPARGAARAMSLNRDGILRLDGVNYTTCPEGHDDWQIMADSVTLDTDRSVGTARDARIEFMGVPILRLPNISFPIGDARKSGLLFPSLGSTTNSGAQLSIPYYLNLAPNQDLTLTPTLYSSRGVDVEAEYRRLSRRSRSEVLAVLMPSDRKANQARSRLRVQHRTELAGNWRLSVNAENVSDARYFEDFSQGADGASIAFLPRELRLDHRSTHLDAGLMVRNFQILDQQLPQIDRPHTELPRLFARGSWNLPGALPLHYGVDTEVVGFRHSNDVQGWRFDAAPTVSLDYTGAAYFLKPTLTLQSTHYKLRDTAPSAPTSVSRTLPMVSLDSGLLFERGTGKRGQRRITLEPRLMYLYVPYREQSDIPVFDTGEPDLNWVELFRSNRYVGIDRISDANQVSAGFTSHMYSSRSGARFLTTTIGQTFYFSAPRVRLPDEPAAIGNSSDITAQVELQAFKDWNVSLGMQWDHGNTRTQRSEARIRYQPAPGSVVNLGYRFQRDRLEQADISLAWPVTDQWRLYGRALYSLQDKQSIEHFGGFEYSSCCWSVRAVARNYVSRRSGERDQSYFLQLELKGLSNVGLAADAFLEKAIRGYSANRRRR
jgi:LPS-assembly protein